MPRTRRRYELVHTQIQQFTRMLPGLEKGDVRALHRARIASRRLREMLPLLNLGGDVSAKLGRRLRKVTRRLGAVRELDAMILLINELHESDRYDNRALARVGARVQRKRSEVRKRLTSKSSMAELVHLADKLDRQVRQREAHRDASGPARRKASHSWQWAAEARVPRRAERLHGAVENAGAVYLPERLHAVRIALKKLRYAVELTAQIAGNLSSADLRRLKAAQTLLGRLHDRQILIDRTREVQAALTPPDLAVWRSLDALVDALENDCRRLHGRYMRDRESLVGVCRRLGGRDRVAEQTADPVDPLSAKRGAAGRAAAG